MIQAGIVLEAPRDCSLTPGAACSAWGTREKQLEP